MPRPQITQDPAPDWSESDYLILNDFNTIAARRVELKIQRDAIDKELETLNLEIGAMLATARLKSVVFGFHRLSLSYSTKGGKLSKTRLLELGVTTDILEAATSPKEVGNPFVSVTEINAPEDSE